MLKTILVAADGSDHAEKAVDWAIELAAKQDARLVLIFVAPHREAPLELRRLAEVEHIVAPGGVERRRLETPPYPTGPLPRPDLQETMLSSARIYREIGQRVLEAARAAPGRDGRDPGRAWRPGASDHRGGAQARRRPDRHGPPRLRRPERPVAGQRVARGVCQLADCACLTVK